MTRSDLARARGALQIQLSGDASPRMTARRVSQDLQQKINDPEFVPFVLYATDLPTRDRVNLQAASILHANDIAASVSAQDRADLGQLIDDECRQSALKSRPLARPASGKTGGQCAAIIRSSLGEVSEIMEHISPFSQTNAQLPAQHARLSAAAEMALSQVSLADD